MIHLTIQNHLFNDEHGWSIDRRLSDSSRIGEGSPAIDNRCNRQTVEQELVVRKSGNSSGFDTIARNNLHRNDNGYVQLVGVGEPQKVVLLVIGSVGP